MRKQRHKQSVPFVTQVSEVLNKLYAEGLRHIELDEDSRAYLNSASTDVQVKVSMQCLRFFSLLCVVVKLLLYLCDCCFRLLLSSFASVVKPK